VLELPVAALLGNLVPAIDCQQVDHLAHLHVATRCNGKARLEQVSTGRFSSGGLCGRPRKRVETTRPPYRCPLSTPPARCPFVTTFALPQIAIVKPRLVICLGLATFTAASLACGQSVPLKMATAIESPFRFEDSLIYCQSHPGHFGRINRNKAGVDRVSQDWVLMRERAGLHFAAETK